MRHRLASVALLLTVAVSAAAQVRSDVPSISTSGSAEVRVVPDRIEIAVGVETIDRELGKAKSENDQAVTKVIAAARARGIDAGKIQTDFISIEPDYDTRPERPPVLYTVRKSIVIESSDVAGFEALLSALLDAGANHVHNVRFMTSELRRHRDEARKLATQAALEKARLLAESLGRKVGEVRQISESSDSWSSSYGSWWGRWGGAHQNVMQNVASPAPAAEGGAMAPGRISVSASVHVTFGLE